VPEEVFEPWVCDALGLNPAELQTLDYETVSLHLAYRDGKALAQWVADNPGGERKRGRSEAEHTAGGD
jgi:hypothetical protein